MGKTVEFNKGYKLSVEYQKQISLTIEKLTGIEEELIGMAFSIAAVGKWKEWSESKKEGDVFTFTEEMLKDTGDENIDYLASLIDQVNDVKEKVKNNLL